jgi:adenine-specific DNA-methyltransferase
VKYMGSKATMLKGALGDYLLSESEGASRFVDLFSGSGAVSHFVATKVAVPVVSVDQLQFASVLAAAVTQRTRSFEAAESVASWVTRARSYLKSAGLGAEIASNQPPGVWSGSRIRAERARVRRSAVTLEIWRDYAGHYFSPTQAAWLAGLQATLPTSGATRTVLAAALLRTASRSSASPGHTAQPFQPTDRLVPHISSAWSRDVLETVLAEATSIARSHAQVRGEALVGDAERYAAHRLRDGDVVFLDPPYSEAQYSRFYHVLEGIARGGWPSVSGAGRSPDQASRPRSRMSSARDSVEAFSGLLNSIGKHDCTVVITYPEGDRSNRLTVSDIDSMASPRFSVAHRRIEMAHSTLGGSGQPNVRAGRMKVFERLIVLKRLP